MRKLFPLLAALLLTMASAAAWAQSAGSGAAGTCAFQDTVRQSRPEAGQGATRILVAAYLVDVTSIDDATQSFDADIFLRFSWKDARLAHAGAGPCTAELTEIWNPRVVLANQRQVQRQLKEVAEISPDGAVRYVQRFYGTFSLPLDLGLFPFDRQVLPVTLVARAAHGDVELVPDPTLLSRAQRLSTPNWEIGELATAAGEYSLQPGFVVPQLEISFPARRLSDYYVWKLLIPMSIVVLMSWAAFWISPQHIAPRIGLCATSMLTLIAFRLALGSSLPPIPYLTRFDLFTVGATVLVLLALVQAVITTALWDRDKQVLAWRFNRGAQILFPLLFLSVAMLSFVRLG